MTLLPGRAVLRAGRIAICNLYTSKTTAQEVASHFRAQNLAGNAGAGEIYPNSIGMVIREVDGARVLNGMNWGFPVRLKGMKETSKPKPVNNARDDKLLSNRSIWRPWFTNPVYRCLIPFTAFAEAEGEKGKMTRTWISVTNQPLAAWAGLWRPTDEWGDCYTGAMVDATEELFHIHDRMPVILKPEAHDAWLRAPADEAMDLVQKYPAAMLAVERTDELWFRKKGGSAPSLI